MEAIAQVIKKINPDLAGLQEFETKTNKVGKADIIALMKEVTGMPYAFFVKTRDVDGGEYGNLILSKYPIRSELRQGMQRAENRKRWKGFLFRSDAPVSCGQRN